MNIERIDLEKERPLAALITLRKACRQAGITTELAVKLMPDDFPPAKWLGKRRVIGRARCEAWLARHDRRRAHGMNSRQLAK